MLDIWPPLPIEVLNFDTYRPDNIIAALEHNDRVCRITLVPDDDLWYSEDTSMQCRNHSQS